jgi:hypothetical protein
LDFVLVTTKDFLTWSFSLLILNLIVLIAWTVVAPMEYSRFDKEAKEDVFGRTNEYYGTCASSKESTSFGATLLVLNIVFVILGNYWAWKTRNIETEYKESRYVALSLAFILQAWILGLPILFVVWDIPHAKYFVAFGVIFVTTLACLGTIFIPKMMAIRTDRKMRDDEGKRISFMSFVAERKRGSAEQEIDSDSNDEGPEDTTNQGEGEDVPVSGVTTEKMKTIQELSMSSSEDVWVSEIDANPRASVNIASSNSIYPSSEIIREEEEDEDEFGEVSESLTPPVGFLPPKRPGRRSVVRMPSFAIKSTQAKPTTGGTKIKYNPRVSHLRVNMSLSSMVYFISNLELTRLLARIIAVLLCHHYSPNETCSLQEDGSYHGLN